MMSFAGLSQTTDTICFPVEVVKKVLIAAEQKKVLESQVLILNERIANYQSIIGNLNSKDSLTVATYESQLKIYKDEKAIYEDQIKGYERLLKRERFKRKLTTFGGILTTAVMSYLFIIKK